MTELLIKTLKNNPIILSSCHPINPNSAFTILCKVMETRVAALKCPRTYNFLSVHINPFFIPIGAKCSRGIFVLVMDELKTGRSFHFTLIREIEFFLLLKIAPAFLHCQKKLQKTLVVWNVYRVLNDLCRRWCFEYHLDWLLTFNMSILSVLV